MIDIWPKYNLEYKYFNFNSIESVEKAISKKFNYPHVVLLSSGRSSIVSCFKSLNLRRFDKVGFAPYANACIFRTLGEVATPVPSNIDIGNLKGQLIHHQWGYVQRTKLKSIIVEDSIDSLIINKKGLFPNNGDYEIVSLSKLLRLPYGAIVFCKNKLLKDSLVKVRNNNKSISSIQFYLKIIGKYSSTTNKYWDHLETLNSYPGNKLNDLIIQRIENYDMIIFDRKKKLDLIKKYITVEISNYRLPIVVPLDISKKKIDKIKKLKKFINLYRHFNINKNSNNWKLKKFFPLPIHQDVDLSTIKEIKKILD